MLKTRYLPLLLALFFIVTGCTSSMNHGGSASPAQPIAMDHSSSGATAHAASKPAGHDMNAMKGMDGMAEMNKSHAAMMTHMQAMQAQMAKIKTTKNPAMRKNLMREHLAGMSSGMKMMRNMGNMKMDSCPMMTTMSADQGKPGMTGMMGDMTMCHTMMKQKAEMMNSMLEQIIESQKQLLEISK